jgi:hypothetical protein
MKYDILVENWNKYIAEELGSINTATVNAQAAEAEAAAVPTQTQQQSKTDSVETVKDLLKSYIRDHVSKVTKTAQISKDELKAMLPAVVDAALQGIQESKKKRAKVVKKKSGDRCTRIAKRKYDVWPSAYASGAVVKCRQGKIWKGISESATDEEIDLALLTEEIEIIEEKWSDKYKSSINCKNPKGFSQKAHCQGRKKK